MARRVVVTGVGLVSALGIGTDETWKNILAGKSGVAPISLFDATGYSTTIAAEVKNFDPLQFVDKKELKKMGRFIQFALAASHFAFQQAQLEITPDLGERTGVFIGSGIGGFDVIEREHSALLEGGPRRVSPFFIPAAIANLASGFVSIRYGAKGPNSATSTACSASAHAVGDSFRLIQRGDADVMICGGAEAAITPLGVGGFAAMRALSTRNDQPEKASRPFERDRDGSIKAETWWNADWYKEITDGKLATVISGGWYPEWLQLNSKGSAGKWRVATVPQWDPSNPQNGQRGGSGFYVSSQSKSPEAAADFVLYLNSARESLVELHNKSQLPILWSKVFTEDVAPTLANIDYPYVGGQKITPGYGIRRQGKRDRQGPRPARKRRSRHVSQDDRDAGIVSLFISPLLYSQSEAA